jgi:RNA polymerase sigma-70 factor (ECF subfamily)
MVMRRPSSSEPRTGPIVEACTHWSDADVVAAVARADPRAGGILYDRLIRIVEWTVVRIAGRRDSDREDLIQAAFEQIFITLRRGRYARDCSLTSWAATLSCHVALNALRAERRRGRFWQMDREHAAGVLLAAAPPDPDRQLAARQRLQRVRMELARMSPARAEVLVLHEVNGLDLSEIARVLGISSAAAQSRLSRGRRDLTRRLGADAATQEAES